MHVMPTKRSAATLGLLLGALLALRALSPGEPAPAPPGAQRAPTAPPLELVDGCVVASLDQLSGWAERVVLGRVVATRCAWSEDRRAIYTHVTVAVREALAGRVAGAEVTVRVLGGSLPAEDVRLEVSHQPRLAVGDEAILFIDDDPGLRTQLVGDRQGVLRLVPGPAGPGLRDGFDRHVVALGPGGRLVTGAAPAPGALDEVLARLRSGGGRRG